MLLARIEIGVTKFSKKTAEKEEEFFLVSEIFSIVKVAAHPCKMSFFGAEKPTLGGGGYNLAREKPTFLGGGITSKLD